MGGPNFADLAIKISYQGRTKVARSLPKSIGELCVSIQTTFNDVFSNMPDFADFEMYHIDSDGEKCMIETDEDLLAAYSHAKHFEQCLLKTYLEYKHGFTDKQK